MCPIGPAGPKDVRRAQSSRPAEAGPIPSPFAGSLRLGALPSPASAPPSSYFLRNELCPSAPIFRAGYGSRDECHPKDSVLDRRIVDI
jgi:hypothetical protein